MYALSQVGISAERKSLVYCSVLPGTQVDLEEGATPKGQKKGTWDFQRLLAVQTWICDIILPMSPEMYFTQTN